MYGSLKTDADCMLGQCTAASADAAWLAHDGTDRYMDRQTPEICVSRYIGLISETASYGICKQWITKFYV